VEDNESASQIVEHLGYLFAIAYNLLGNASDAEDAVQESVCKFLQTRPHLEAADKLRAYLARTVAHHCLDELRHKAKSPCRSLASCEAAQMAAVQENDSTPDSGNDGELESWLRRLPAKDRLVLDLFYREEMSIEKIAEVVGDSTGAVKVRLHRARQALREIAQDKGDKGDKCGEA
jgi:RNA polymerase sigma-70 factor (ECF subfamily)